MFKRVLALLATMSVLIGIVTVGAPAAFANGNTEFQKYWAGCGATVFARLNDNTGWSTAQIGAVRAAVHAWNSVRDTCDPFIDFDGGTTLVHWNGCNTAGNINIERVGVGGIPGHPNADGWTDNTECDNGNAIDVVHLYFADYNGQNEDAYWGDSIPEPDGRYGEEGLITHEMGHALGFYGHWQDYHPAWCNNAAQGGGPADWETMCQGMFVNASGETQQNRDTDLTAHDYNAFNSAY